MNDNRTNIKVSQQKGSLCRPSLYARSSRILIAGHFSSPTRGETALRDGDLGAINGVLIMLRYGSNCPGQTQLTENAERREPRKPSPRLIFRRKARLKTCAPSQNCKYDDVA
jgi:hypothetical protein